MQPTKFDELTKALASATSRRHALRTIVTASVGSLVGLGGIRSVFGGKKPPPPKNPCQNWCNGVFGSGTPAAQQCISDAAQHKGLCYQCGSNPCGSVCCVRNRKGYCTSYSGANCCSTSQVCHNGVCGPCITAGSTCSKSTDCCSHNCCHGVCCDSGQSCINGTCCSKNQVCSCGCCPAGQSCVKGRCCPTANICGSVCLSAPCDTSQCQHCDPTKGMCVGCPPGHICQGTVCCEDTNAACTGNTDCCSNNCCDGKCCDANTTCVNGTTCCPAGQACGSVCGCPGGVCVNGMCCPTGQVCGSAPTSICCGSGLTCVGGACCPAGQVCQTFSGPVCCGSGLTCSGGQCCPTAQACNAGSTCCDPLSTCVPNGGAAGSFCCPTYRVCNGGATCCGITQTCCGTVCCDQGRTCCGDTCCPQGQTCNTITNTCCFANPSPCTADAQCCSGICDDTSMTCVSCIPGGDAGCGSNTDCCTGLCAGGTCCPSANICGLVCLVAPCNANQCLACDGSGNCVNVCDTGGCLTCDGSGFCVSTCDPGECQTCANGTCVSTCDAGQCLTCDGHGNCVSSCSSGQKCCSGTCAQCCIGSDCPTGQDCNSGVCSGGGVCVPNCSGKTCGDDGCGGTCAPGCDASQCYTCDAASGTCVTTCAQGETCDGSGTCLSGGGGGGGGGGDGCFVAGTPVVMAGGYHQSIDSIQSGDAILAWNEDTSQIFPTPVVEALHHEERMQTLFDLELEDRRKITVNDNHPMYVAEDEAFIFSGELATRFGNGKPITFLGDNNEPVKLVSLRTRTERCKTYNLHVKGQGEMGHSYFANGILVHNARTQKKIRRQDGSIGWQPLARK